MSSAFNPPPQDAAIGSQEDHDVNCPHCGEGFDLSEAMSHRHQETIEFQVREAVSARVQELDALKAKVKKQEADVASAVASGTALRMKAEAADMRKALEEELAAKQKVQSDELVRLREKVKEGHGLEAELEGLKAAQELALDKARTEGAVKAAKEKRDALLEQRQSLDAEAKLGQRALERKLERMEQALEEARKQSDQGSQQEQGEVQEVVLEDVLRTAFPTDHVEEVGKGVRGADCMLRIHDPHQPTTSCGILFESKRTKTFQKAWIAKFKEDMRAAGADAGILVTQAMPDGAAGPTQVDGVFICRLQDVHFVAQVVRSGLLRFSSALLAQQGKAGKVERLYDYMTGPLFKLAWENVRTQYVRLRESHDADKRTFLQRWKREEKMLASAEQSVIDFLATVLEIGGGSLDLPSVYSDGLEGLPDSEGASEEDGDHA